MLGLVVWLFLSYLNLMALAQSTRMIMVTFAATDKPAQRLRPAVDKNLTTLRTLTSYIEQEFHDFVRGYEFAIEILDIFSGIYKRFDDLEEPVPWRNGLLVILILRVETYQEQLLSIKGKAFDLRNGFSIGDNCLHIEEHRCNGCDGEDGATGLNMWDAAIVLAKYIEINSGIVQGKRILELGAGTGLVGISAHLMGAQYSLLTDLEYALPNLKQNVEHNSADNSTITVSMLDWFEQATYPTGRWDVVLGADVVWLEHLVAPLVHTISSCIDSQSVLILSHQVGRLDVFSVALKLHTNCILIIKHYLLRYACLHIVDIFIERVEVSGQTICYSGNWASCGNSGRY
jgi:hypothetical protein